jgi:hypothetical protein
LKPFFCHPKSLYLSRIIVDQLFTDGAAGSFGGFVANRLFDAFIAHNFY